MSVLRRIRWGKVLAAALLAEAAILVVFFLLLGAAFLAGVPEMAAPMSTLDNIDAIVSSFVMMYLMTLWLGKRIDSDFVLHGALVGLDGRVPVHAPVDNRVWISCSAAGLRRRALPEGGRRHRRRRGRQARKATSSSRLNHRTTSECRRLRLSDAGRRTKARLSFLCRILGGVEE